jgi:hypothetical protein
MGSEKVHHLCFLIPNAFEDQPASEGKLTDENGDDHIIEYRIIGTPG